MRVRNVTTKDNLDKNALLSADESWVDVVPRPSSNSIRVCKLCNVCVYVRAFRIARNQAADRIGR